MQGGLTVDGDGIGTVVDECCDVVCRDVDAFVDGGGDGVVTDGVVMAWCRH